MNPMNLHPVLVDDIADFDGDVVDRVCDLDRAYFKRHPKAATYIRRYQPGEGLTRIGEASPPFVLVTFLDDHHRTRQPFRLVNKCA